MLQTLNFDKEDLFEKSMIVIAQQLTSERLLQVNNSYFLLTDIEFYIRDKDYKTKVILFHNDAYTHGHDQQLTHGQIYVHGSGFDITIGNKDFYGGVLCRGAFLLDKNGIVEEYLDGPIKLKTAVFAQLHSLETNDTNTIRLVKSEFHNIQNLYLVAVTRVGLSPSKDTTFYDKPYRFVALYDKKKYNKFKPKGIEKIVQTGKLNNGKLLNKADQENVLGYALK